MHTTTEPTLRDLQQVMIGVQIAALETLERLMGDQELTGNEKADKAKATERNRQRMSATQTLIHCRTMQRELRERREQSHRIKQDERQAASKAPHQLATLRRLHKLNPDEYDNPDAVGSSSGTSRARQEAASPPSPLEGEGVDRSQIDRRMRGSSSVAPVSDQCMHRSETGATTHTYGANPSPQPSPSHSRDGGEGANLSDQSACGMLKQSLSMSSASTPNHAQTSLSMPHEPAEPFPTPTPKRLTRFQIEDAERKRQITERIRAKHEAKMQRKNR